MVLNTIATGVMDGVTWPVGFNSPVRPSGSLPVESFDGRVDKALRGRVVPVPPVLMATITIRMGHQIGRLVRVEAVSRTDAGVCCCRVEYSRCPPVDLGPILMVGVTIRMGPDSTGPG